MVDFSVSVPINMKGTTGSAGGGGVGDKMTKQLEKLNSNTLKLNKTMFMNIDVIEIASALVGDLYKVLRPLFQILSLLFLVIFLPLMPIIMLMVKGLAKLVKLLSGGYGSIAGLIGKTIIGILLLALAAVLVAIGGPMIAVVAAIVGALALLWEPIWEALKFIGSFLWEGVQNAVEQMKLGFAILGSLGIQIWEWIKGLFTGTINVITVVFDWFKGLFIGTIDVISNVWDFIKSLFRGTIDVASTVWSWFTGLFSGGSNRGRASGGPVMAGQSYLVGERGPEIFSPNQSGTIIPNGKRGGVSVTINNPSVRNDGDIKKIANQVSQVLQRQMTGRGSQ